MAEKLRVVHYINQFFAQIGGEESASMGIQTEDKPIGPGISLQAALRDRAEIVGTIICGDNYIAENIKTVTQEVLKVIEGFKPDMFFAGPAFNAGRYGIACGSLCKAVKKKLGIPAVTAMFDENPGREIYAPDIFILRSGNNARKMAEEIKKMVDFAYKLYDGTLERDPEKEGFFERGWMVAKKYDYMASKRAVDMLINKVQGRPFKTEIPMPVNEKIPSPVPIADLSKATIMFATDGALCTKENTERMPSAGSNVYHAYNVDGKKTLSSEEYTCVHGGFDRTYAIENPNRLVPLDAMRALEEEGITKFHNEVLSCAGLAGSLSNGMNIGKSMVEYIKNHNIDAVILTST
ncbi:glycine reductase complex component B subunit gamma [Oxobacter pfennigii]|uniref:Glycine reductase complex component B subunit gamma n=2 Tax=Oxobacter pfennigii TaxID=36849 RepID=A0A0P8W2R5_9CLOT|nr:glycine reductase complex component B subunit gamma [Oxobacter pfennigii]